MAEDKKPIKAFIAIEDDKEFEARKKINKENLDAMIQGVRDELFGAVMVKKEEPKKKGPEEKEYILLLLSENGDAPGPWWEICTGRTAAYEYLKQYIELIEIHDSFVLVEGIPSERRITVYQFLRHIQDKGFYNDSFDIEDYNTGDNGEDDFEDNSNVQGNNSSEEQPYDNEGPVNPFIRFEANEVNV